MVNSRLLLHRNLWLLGMMMVVVVVVRRMRRVRMRLKLRLRMRRGLREMLNQKPLVVDPHILPPARRPVPPCIVRHRNHVDRTGRRWVLELLGLHSSPLWMRRSLRRDDRGGD